MSGAGVVAHVISLSGSVWQQEAGQTEPLHADTALLAGAELITGSGSSLHLRLAQGQELRLGPDQHLVLDADVLADAQADASEWTVASMASPLQLAELLSPANSLPLDSLIEPSLPGAYASPSPEPLSALGLDDSSLLDVWQQLKHPTPPDHH